uniref:Uncharacterized protein n=1 Tax=Candidatus Kentrum eta TaxID=2126337 RepID=A0A450UKP7_9GAMM|nr:MAG: hypothetical protein BECKH772A_GA0070896_1003811 [Candidatus Kentron sp. H]VFJ93084.1 MAG: hypothetical protein BECKH772B_GA0070898_1003811 [Candidatus Kentron sp. H]VFJ99935.1 MAG: hypothetical protein BECKH772C_GA0070978_1003711 [Candidatus Kentron sp. H]
MVCHFTIRFLPLPDTPPKKAVGPRGASRRLCPARRLPAQSAGFPRRGMGFREGNRPLPLCASLEIWSSPHGFRDFTGEIPKSMGRTPKSIPRKRDSTGPFREWTRGMTDSGPRIRDPRHGFRNSKPGIRNSSHGIPESKPVPPGLPSLIYLNTHREKPKPGGKLITQRIYRIYVFSLGFPNPRNRHSTSCPGPSDV